MKPRGNLCPAAPGQVTLVLFIYINIRVTPQDANITFVFGRDTVVGGASHLLDKASPLSYSPALSHHKSKKAQRQAYKFSRMGLFRC